MTGINLSTAQTVIEGKLLVLTLNDEARPGAGRMVKNQELFDLFQEFEVTDFEQAMPFARSPLLRKVYGLEFTGNHEEFLAILENDYSEYITDILEFYEPVDNFEPEDGLWKSNELWNDEPHKKRHKDIDARWTKKNKETFFGYKNHAKVGTRGKFITKYKVTDASVHDYLRCYFVVSGIG